MSLLKYNSSFYGGLIKIYLKYVYIFGSFKFIRPRKGYPKSDVDDQIERDMYIQSRLDPTEVLWNQV